METKYQNLINYIQEQITDGQLGPGEKVPSENQLAERFHISRQTVRKAIGTLEEEGLVQSHAGAKSCICATEARCAALRQEMTESELRAMVRSMKRMGLSAAEAAALVEKLYEEESE